MRTRQIKVQLVLFIVISLVAAGFMVFGYMKVPAMLGVGRYTVVVEMPRSGGLYERANVTYRGSEVGRVQSVRLTATGVQAALSLRAGVEIPSDVDVQVHSENALGEQFVELVPRQGPSRSLRNGDVIARDRVSIPPDINYLLDSVNQGIQAIPRENLKTAVDEAYTAVGGLGPEILRLVKGSTALAIDARQNLDPLTTLIDQSEPVLDSQVQSSDAVAAWAAHLADITTQLQTENSAVVGVLDHGGKAADEARRLFDQLQPTVPILLANLVSLGEVGITYRNDIEQLLVLLPQATGLMQAVMVPDQNTNLPYKGPFLSFNLNVNLPPACTTGYLPAQQRRPPSMVDYPERPDGALYCRIPQDSINNVRGARNIPCETRPGKRAATVKECESDQEYVPLNDGLNWKGDPNATMSGQDVPELPPPVAVAPYDPATGTYIGPDGKVYRQSDLAQTAPGEKTWQNMLVPPTGN
ncbi:MlaD family protein [Mycobacterium sp. CVI_P3]|uniref:MlaD family protein n=1 Tax=Mycobacterium pinniadriaticum TaxID=2994102 RepID=A0ABT3SH14_9MYCO|nr:MlaD family protein [Mycobacterium pinniadriaticum]MCX2932405.1 MlaD family protein [Mycobacterium pinniadriaticum]MCX2938738.1 MlaD family protein [Mycobacterium pinniadriaticum]